MAVREVNPPEESSIELSIVMPCLNESETIGPCVENAISFLRRARISGEVVVGDNGSTDGSQDIARVKGARVIHVKERGYGAACYFASKAAVGKYIIMGDSDESYDFSSLEPFVEKLRAGYDLVMGNRFAGGIRRGAMPFLNRYLGNPVLSGIGRLLFTNNVRDFHCGLRGYSKGAFERLDLQTMGMEFASEMVLKAAIKQMQICEVPTTLSPDGRSGKPHLRPWRDGWRHLRLLLLYSPNWLFLYPGIFLFLAGFGTLAVLMQGPVMIYGFSFNIATLAWIVGLIVIGYQLCFFSIFAKIFAMRSALIPGSRLGRFSARYLTLELGLLVGVLLLACGIGAGIYGLYVWSQASFGEQSPELSMRISLAGMLAFTLGVQTIFSSFVLSFFQLKVRGLIDSSSLQELHRPA